VRLWLDGKFWGPWIRTVFVSEIEWMRRSAFEHVLPSFPDPGTEADKATGAAWEMAMSQPAGGSDDPASCADWAKEKGLETYLGTTQMRQAAANLFAVMLWHVLQQQMLLFHVRQVLKVQEEQEARRRPKTRDKFLSLATFLQRLDAGGCSMRGLPSWAKVAELQLVANAVKHGPGKSLDALGEIRPDLLGLPETETLEPLLRKSLRWVERPAGGEDIYVSDADLSAYFDAATGLWREFSDAIEEHSARKKSGDVVLQ
jgi:hypothetical protein